MKSHLTVAVAVVTLAAGRGGTRRQLHDHRRRLEADGGQPALLDGQRRDRYGRPDAAVGISRRTTRSETARSASSACAATASSATASASTRARARTAGRTSTSTSTPSSRRDAAHHGDELHADRARQRRDDADKSPPKDYAAYKQFIQAVVQHCVDRYGAADVGQWYWEIWNEPDYPGFWNARR